MSQQDYFRRTPFAIDILNMVEALPTPFAFGLDSDWGAGKSFFIQNTLLPEAIKKGIPCIVYDAFEHEKDGDVFLSLMTSILEQAQRVKTKSNDSLLQTTIRETVSKTAKVVSAVGSIALNAGSKLILKQGFEEIRQAIGKSADSEEILSGNIEKEVEKFICERLKQGKSYQALKIEFQTSVRSLAATLSEQSKILVVVDELDRCTPVYALQVLEAINHILNTEGLIFMLSYQRGQLETMVEHTYGKGVNANAYLQKFVSFNLKFPSLHINEFRSANAKIMSDRAKNHSSALENNGQLVNSLQFIGKWSDFAPLTPRQVQQYTSIALKLEGKLDYSLADELTQAEISALIYWKLTNPRALAKLLNKTTKLPERRTVMDELQFHEFLPETSLDKEVLLSGLFFENLNINESQTAEIYKKLQIFDNLV